MSAVFRLTIKILIAGRIIFHKFLLSAFPFSFVELFGNDTQHIHTQHTDRESEKEREGIFE